MEKNQNDKKISELDLYRNMRETQARMGLLSPGARRLERISSIVMQLRNLPESDFENTLVAIEAMLERFNKAQSKKASQTKAKTEAANALGDVLHTARPKRA